MAFKRLGIEVESIGFSEIDKYAIQSYQAIHGNHKSWGSITDIKGKDLPEIDVFTYSFPCTDLSKAGKQKGLSNTRSGLVYEVLRILHELEKEQRLPKVLIMENVVDLVQVKFIKQFQEIQLELEELGYSNYTETLNAKDYGVAQNRDRVFMVSILGDYYYEFPKPIKLEKRLRDYLETNVDKKYRLSDRMLQGMMKTNFNSYQLENRLQDLDGCISTIFQKRGVVQKQMIQTIKANNSDIGVVVSDLKREYCNRLLEEGLVEPYDMIRHSYTNDRLENDMERKEGQNDISAALTTRPDTLGVVVYDDYNSSIRADQNTIGTLTTNCGSSAERNGYKLIEKENNNLVIRKLTPLEVWRLMGIDDEDFYKAQKSGVPSSQMYKQAGNGIVVDVFAAILKTMVKGEQNDK